MVRLFRLVSLIMAVATVITMLTPSKSDDAVLQSIKNILNICAGNILYNTNLDDPQKGAVVQDFLETAEQQTTSIVTTQQSSVCNDQPQVHPSEVKQVFEE